MSVLQILQYPDERLRTVAKSVEKIDAEVQRIVDDMLETLYATDDGIGLAATQVNIHLQIIVMDLSQNRDKPVVLINPKLLKKSGETEMEEGCLSIPGQTGLVPRSSEVTVRALDKEGHQLEINAEGLLPQTNEALSQFVQE